MNTVEAMPLLGVKHRQVCHLIATGILPAVKRGRFWHITRAGIAKAKKRKTTKGAARTPVAVRFWKNVKKGEGCWLWTAGRTKQGYGIFMPDPETGTGRPAHRTAWELANGKKVPEGPCVRPSHLFVGTSLDNRRDCCRKGRQAKGDRHGMRKLKLERMGK